MPLELHAARDDDGRRLDRILRKALPDMPLSTIHRLLRQGQVLVEGKAEAADRRIRTGERISISGENEMPREKARRPNWKCDKPSFSPNSDYSPQEGKLEILFEGAGLLVLNKPAGLAVHGGASNSKRGEGSRPAISLEDLVRAYLEPKLPPSLSFRPGPLHRLDKPSSGAIAFSTSIEGARIFSGLLRERRIKKTYLALVEGLVEKDEIWEDALVRDRTLMKSFPEKQGAEKACGETKTAITRVKPLARNANASLILAEIETGRTHQIRAQAAFHGHPLLGDKKYGSYPAGNRRRQLPGGFFLHAWRLEFPADLPFPGTAELPRAIEAPLCKEFLLKIRELFGEGIGMRS